MGTPLSLIRHLLWRRRVAEVRAWQDDERRRAAANNEIIRAILEQAGEVSGTPERAS